jgi:hypothetical protein
MLNPFSYVSTSTEINNQFQTFMDLQNNPVTADRNYYPFTEVNPFLPWYSKVKVAILGEGTFDALQRLKDKTYAERIYESIRISKGKYTDVVGLSPAVSPIPGFTPSAWANVGVGVKNTFTSFNDTILHLNIENKFNSLTPLPQAVPTAIVPLPESILTDVSSWSNAVVDKTSIAETSDMVKEWKAKQLVNVASDASTSKVTLDELASKNKFELLKEEVL